MLNENPIKIILPLALMLFLPGCGDSKQGHFQGYVEGEFLQIASPLAGQLGSLAVSRGMTVEEDARPS